TCALPIFFCDPCLSSEAEQAKESDPLPTHPEPPSRSVRQRISSADDPAPPCSDYSDRPLFEPHAMAAATESRDVGGGRAHGPRPAGDRSHGDESDARRPAVSGRGAGRADAPEW